MEQEHWEMKKERWARWRAEMHVEADGKCHYCKTLTYLPEPLMHPRKDTATLDHYLPRGQGGRSKRENLVLACYRCNMIKGELHGDEYTELFRIHGYAKVKGACKSVQSKRFRQRDRARSAAALNASRESSGGGQSRSSRPQP